MQGAVVPGSADAGCFDSRLCGCEVLSFRIFWVRTALVPVIAGALEVFYIHGLQVH